SGRGGELHPMGADAGIIKPPTWPSPTSTGKIEPYYGLSDLTSATQGCELDGIPTPCEVLTNDNSMQCPDNQCKKGSQLFYAFADGCSGYAPTDARYLGHGLARSESAGSGSLEELAGVVSFQKSPGSLPQKPYDPRADFRDYAEG